MQTRSSDENSVCPSVCQTRSLWENGRKICPDFLYHMKDHWAKFLRTSMVGGGDPFYLKFWSTGPRWSEIANFEPIFARSTSAVTPSEKSSITTNRKSTTRYPMRIRWSLYVAPKPPKRDSKTQNGRFPSKIALRVKKSPLQSFFVWKLSASKL